MILSKVYREISILKKPLYSSTPQSPFNHLDLQIYEVKQEYIKNYKLAIVLWLFVFLQFSSNIHSSEDNKAE